MKAIARLVRMTDVFLMRAVIFYASAKAGQPRLCEGEAPIDFSSGVCRRGLLLARVRGRAVSWAAAVVLACVAGEAAAGSPPVLAFTPAPYAYGSVTDGQTASQTFTLKNSGGSASSALKVVLSGSSAFVVTSDSCSATSLGPGRLCAVVVRFAPTSPAAATATLTVTSNKPVATASDALNGTGAGHIYWTNDVDGTIWRAALDGSNPAQLVSGQNTPAGVAVDSSHVYWANFGDSTIWKANLDGSNPTQLESGQNSPIGVAVDSSHVYWTDTADEIAPVGTIWKAGLDGSNPTQLVSGQITPEGIAVDSSHIYWVDEFGQSFSNAGLDGSNPTVLISCNGCLGRPIGLAIDSSHAYIADVGFNVVYTADLDGSNLTGLVAAPFPLAVAVDSSHVYWANFGDSTIWKANLDGSNPTLLESGVDVGDAGLAVGP